MSGVTFAAERSLIIIITVKYVPQTTTFQANSAGKYFVFLGEHKNIDKEYIANTEEVERPLVSPEEEVEETTDPQAITYFPGGRFINTEELEEMKKENEYYERMRKIGKDIKDSELIWRTVFAINMKN